MLKPVTRNENVAKSAYLNVVLLLCQTHILDYKYKYMLNTFLKLTKPAFLFIFCFRQRPFYSTDFNSVEFSANFSVGRWTSVHRLVICQLRIIERIETIGPFIREKIRRELSVRGYKRHISSKIRLGLAKTPLIR